MDDRELVLVLFLQICSYHDDVRFKFPKDSSRHAKGSHTRALSTLPPPTHLADDRMVLSTEPHARVIGAPAS